MLKAGDKKADSKQLATNAAKTLVSQELLDEFTKIQNLEEQKKQQMAYIRLKPNQNIFPSLPLLVTSNTATANQNSFQNIFLNLVPATQLKANANNTKMDALQKSRVKDTNQNLFLNINNTLHKICPIVSQQPNQEQNSTAQSILSKSSVAGTVDDVNISKILNESKTEEVSIEIDPMCFQGMPEEEQVSFVQKSVSNCHLASVLVNLQHPGGLRKTKASNCVRQVC